MELNSELDRLQKYNVIDSELKRAKEKHPNFPDDLFQQGSIMIEEAGEVVKAINDWAWFSGSIESVRDELVQTAAMCMRMIEKISI